MTELQIIARQLVIRMQFQKQPLDFEQAKQCTLICIDNQIKSLKRLNEKWHKPEDAILTSFFDYEIEDLEEVRNEIERL